MGERTCVRERTGQVVRLVDMIRFFEAGGRASVEDLAARYGVSAHTTQRDLLVLQGDVIRLPLVRVGMEWSGTMWQMMDRAFGR